MKLQINVPVSGLDLARVKKGFSSAKTEDKTTSRLRRLVTPSPLAQRQLAE